MEFELAEQQLIFLLSMQMHNPFLKATKLFATKISGTLAVYIGSVKGFEDEKSRASAKCSYFGKESRPETQAITHRSYCFLPSLSDGTKPAKPRQSDKKDRGKKIIFLRMFSEVLLTGGHSKTLLCVHC